MNNLIGKHKNKILLASPVLLLLLFISGAFWVSSIDESRKNVEESRTRDLINQKFGGLDIKAKAFVVYDATEKKVIFSKNELAQLPLASLTKIMSTAVALDLANSETVIEILPDSKSINENDKYALAPGVWRLGDLLKFILVASSNGGISAIADELSTRREFFGGEKYFVELMNQKAKELGLRQTYFLNESGLDINETLAGAYGSPLDIARLFDYAVNLYPEIFGATKFDSITITSRDGKSLSVENTNKTVSLIDGLVASKTGLTDLAEGNLAIVFELTSDKRIIVVVLGSTQTDRFSDVEKLVLATRKYLKLK